MENIKQILESIKFEPAEKKYQKSSYTEEFEVLKSLRNDKVFCDIRLETDDNQVIFAHKVVLASASPYFYAMFTNFAERNHDRVVMRQLDSTALTLLVDFIYSGYIKVTENNLQVLLPAANLLQLQEVKEACCDFLQSQLCPTNCIGINAIADLHNCTKLIKSSEMYIQQHFSEVVAGDEFLSLSSEQVIKLVSSDKLSISSEEKGFESVIRWVKYELDSRKCILPKLMEHVRLPLMSKEYIFKNVIVEPLINNCVKCKDYIYEALHFHLFKSDELIPQNIRNKPRLEDKVILVVGGLEKKAKCTEWYDPIMNRWHLGPKMIAHRCRAGVAVVNNNLVFAVGGIDNDESVLRSVEVLDLSSIAPRWNPSFDMLVKRQSFGVGVINDNLFAVGGLNAIGGQLNSAEVFDYNIEEWRMISSMSTRKIDFGVGVLNNLLYVVGGYSSEQSVATVERYNPSLDKWTPVANMCKRRYGAGVEVLDGVLYAVGGCDSQTVLSSVEAYTPSTGAWTTIADMHFPRLHAGVVTLDGLLYVVGGNIESSDLQSVECYCPNKKTWTMVTASMNIARNEAGAVVIDRPIHFRTC